MSRWSSQLAKKYAPKESKENKYSAQRGEGFPSQLEKAVYGELLWQEKGGLIKDIERQVSYEFTTHNRWKIDFRVFSFEYNAPVYIEAKGLETTDYRFKKNLWHSLGDGLLLVYKGSASDLRVAEKIWGDRYGFARSLCGCEEE